MRHFAERPTALGAWVRNLLARAHGDEHKEIIALRSYAEWLGELDSLNKDEQELLLQASLARIETGSSYPAALVEAWLKGDADRIAGLQSASLDKVPQARQLLQRLVDRRNATMLERIDQELKQHKDGTFVMIRAEQAIGDNGLPALLKKAGFTVKRL